MIMSHLGREECALLLLYEMVTHDEAQQRVSNAGLTL